MPILPKPSDQELSKARMELTHLRKLVEAIEEQAGEAATALRAASHHHDRAQKGDLVARARLYLAAEAFADRRKGR
jgi:hypothetical protein